MKRIYLILFSLLCGVSQCLPQAMNSLTGLYSIPTAEVPKDGEATLGAFFLKKEYLDPALSDFDNNALAYFGSIAFLPFLETSIRFTKPMVPHGGAYAIGDRMFAVKIQVVKEGESLPSIAVGAQDFLHSRATITNLFNSTYIVTTKNAQVTNNIRAKATIGYGFKILDARAYQFIGVFGGASVQFFRMVELIGEYDARNVNGALRLDLLDHFRLLGGIVKGKYFSGGASCYFEL